MRHVYKENGVPVWVDLHDPTPEEIAQACEDCKLTIPTREELDEIESSSRLQADGEKLTLSLPLTPYHPDSDPVSAPIGFVLTPKILATVRFDELHTFHKVGEQISHDRNTYTSAQIFAMLVDSIIDYSADKLEHIQADMRTVSKAVFHRGKIERRNIAREGRKLRDTVVKLGDTGERLSELRETLLALQRTLPFVVDRGGKWIGDDVAAQLKTASMDIQSLNDFETHLTDKVQFLLDATLGFINTEQNDIFKVLTIASIVGIPPTFVVGLYGMNFQNQPEFHWAWGYEWGWLMIIVSVIVPVAWFKWRGWW
ncbi:MAG: magnesium transporter CorA family protein [Rhizomicrobium sp.]